MYCGDSKFYRHRKSQVRRDIMSSILHFNPQSEIRRRSTSNHTDVRLNMFYKCTVTFRPKHLMVFPLWLDECRVIDLQDKKGKCRQEFDCTPYYVLCVCVKGHFCLVCLCACIFHTGRETASASPCSLYSL